MKRFRIISLYGLLILVVLLSGCMGGSTGEHYTVSGFVVDESNNGMQGVEIIVSDKNIVEKSDVNGQWTIPGLKGTVDLTPHKTGFSFDPPYVTVSRQTENMKFEAKKNQDDPEPEPEVNVVTLSSTPGVKYNSIQDAIDLAQHGDIVTVGIGVYFENIDFKGKNIIVESTDPLDWEVVERTIIDGQQDGSVVTIANGEERAILRGLTITNGSGNIFRNWFEEHRSTLCGGGVYIYASSPTIERNIIRENTASAGYGGGIYVVGTNGPDDDITATQPTIVNNRIEDNISYRGGGIAIFRDARVTIGDNSILNNKGMIEGGGLSFGASSGAITDNLFEGNYGQQGGGVAISVLKWEDRVDRVTFTGNIVSNNRASRGGGLSYGYSQRADMTISDNVFEANSANRDGGGVLLDQYAYTYVFSSNVVRDNTAESGGGVKWYGGGTLVGNTISNNVASVSGGGIYGMPIPDMDDDPTHRNVVEDNEVDNVYLEKDVWEVIPISWTR